MKELVKNVNIVISKHEKKIKRVKIAMWVVVLLAITIYFMISVFFDLQLNKIIANFQFALDQGMRNEELSPDGLIKATNDSPLGFLVISMLFARLLAYLGQLRFHLREISKYENYLLSAYRVNWALEDNFKKAKRDAILMNQNLYGNNQEPKLNLMNETIEELSEKISKILTNK